MTPVATRRLEDERADARRRRRRAASPARAGSAGAPRRRRRRSPAVATSWATTIAASASVTPYCAPIAIAIKRSARRARPGRRRGGRSGCAGAASWRRRSRPTARAAAAQPRGAPRRRRTRRRSRRRRGRAQRAMPVASSASDHLEQEHLPEEAAQPAPVLRRDVAEPVLRERLLDRQVEQRLEEAHRRESGREDAELLEPERARSNDRAQDPERDRRVDPCGRRGPAAEDAGGHRRFSVGSAPRGATGAAAAPPLDSLRRRHIVRRVALPGSSRLSARVRPLVDRDGDRRDRAHGGRSRCSSCTSGSSPSTASSSAARRSTSGRPTRPSRSCSSPRPRPAARRGIDRLRPGARGVDPGAAAAGVARRSRCCARPRSTTPSSTTTSSPSSSCASTRSSRSQCPLLVRRAGGPARSSSAGSSSGARSLLRSRSLQFGGARRVRRVELGLALAVVPRPPRSRRALGARR